MIEKIPTVIFEATQRCNLDCNYCYNVWKMDGVEPVAELSTWRTIRMLGKVVKQTGCRQVTFSGGEPLLREDLVELAAFLKLKGVKTSVLTNGELLDRQYVRDLHKVGVNLFQVTLLGLDESIHDSHCGKGSQRHALRAVEDIRAEGVHLSITFILTGRNLSQIEPVMRYVKSIKGRSCMFNRFNPGGEGLRHMDELMVTLEQFRSALETASRLARKLKVRPFFAVPVTPCLAGRKDYPGLVFADCIAGTDKSYFTVDPQGNMRLCNHSPVILGNIRKHKFKAIANCEAVAKFRGAMPDFCRDCEHWKKCMGGCRAASEQLYRSCACLDPFVARLLGRNP
ncbi:MAG: radical SAM protein [Pseudomonadota bacterium]